jgi:succinyl-CoA synthetase beta subunit
MKLYEYQARRILSKYGVPVPDYDVATTSTEARRIAQRLDGPVVIKAQVLVFGRGKAGGIRFAHDADEAEVVAEQILGMTLKGCTVDKVLVDRAIDIQKELYLAIVLDRASCSPVLIASSEGGVEIEEVARTQPEHICNVSSAIRLSTSPRASTRPLSKTMRRWLKSTPWSSPATSNSWQWTAKSPWMIVRSSVTRIWTIYVTLTSELIPIGWQPRPVCHT